MTLAHSRCCAAWLAALSLEIAAQPSPLAPDAPCTATKSHALTTRVDFAAVVTPPYGAEVLRVWLPIPPSDETQEITGSEFATWPLQVQPQFASEEVYGNRFAYFEFAKPKGAQMVRHRFVAKTHELAWNLAAAKVISPAQWPAAFAPYLRHEEQAVAITEPVRTLARRLGGKGGPAVFEAMRWVDANMTYDHGRCSLAASSVWALAKSCGHCSDYHGLTAALGRALAQPARVTYGINLFPNNSPSHCKFEAFLPPYGWVSFDVSATQRQVKAIAGDATLSSADKDRLMRAARARTESGFRDNTWLLLTRGTDYELAPRASKRAAVVRTIYAEADGETLPEPDPGDAGKREFAWMTMHAFTPDRDVSYPYQDIRSLTPSDAAPKDK
jgi:transglutaminase-like putative cysteine protease